MARVSRLFFGLVLLHQCFAFSLPNCSKSSIQASAILRWAATSHTDYYLVYLGTTPTLPSSPTATILQSTSPSYTPAALQSNTTYYWKVVAVNQMCGLLPNPDTPGPVWSFKTTTAHCSHSITSPICTPACYPSGCYNTVTITANACGPVDSNLTLSHNGWLKSCSPWGPDCCGNSSEPECTSFTATLEYYLRVPPGQTISASVILRDIYDNCHEEAPFSITCGNCCP